MSICLIDQILLSKEKKGRRNKNHSYCKEDRKKGRHFSVQLQEDSTNFKQATKKKQHNT